MKQSDQLTLVPDQEEVGRPVFRNAEEDEKFRRSFYEVVKDSLDKWVEARQRSEEQAQRHWCR